MHATVGVCPTTELCKQHLYQHEKMQSAAVNCMYCRACLVGWLGALLWPNMNNCATVSQTGRQGGSTATAASPDVFLGAILLPLHR